MSFIGQSDADGKPNGIVRVVYPYGHVYEGQMTPNGNKNGWGILYNGMYLMIGWFADDCCVGNCIELDG